MRVLLATDGSDSAAVAAELVRNVPWPMGTSIDAVRVVEERGQELAIGAWPGVGLRVPGREVSTAAIQEAEDSLVALTMSLHGSGLETRHTVLRGRPADALLDWIDRQRPDLVIVGNRGVSPFERAVLGSVSGELVDGSPVPVLVARRPTLERVVVAVDGSDIAAEALATVRRWPFLALADIRTLSVVAAPAAWWPGDIVPGLEAATADRLATTEATREHEAIATDAAVALRTAGFRAEPEVLSGSPAHVIVAFATDWGADMVILGSHGRTGLARLLLGSVARNVLHHAGSSVLIVRRHAEAQRGRREEIVARPWTILAAH
jgi:nucleotide-binding universal stress UspA family protein